MRSYGIYLVLVILVSPFALAQDKDASQAPPTGESGVSAPTYQNYKEAYAAGNQALKDRKFSEAVAAYQAAGGLASSDKGKSQAANAQGWACLKARKLEEAKTAFSRAVTENPDNKLALKNLGAVEFDLYEYGMGGVDELRDAVTNLEASGENQEDLDRAKGALTREEGYAQATPVAEPDTSGMGFKALLALCDKLQERGQFDQALKVLKQAAPMATTPASKAVAANYQGKVLLDARRPAESVAYFEAAVDAEPNNKLYLNNLGWSYWTLYDSGKGKMEDLKKAVDNLYKMNSIDPTYHSENLKMALDELKEADPEAAKAYTVKDESSVEDAGAKTDGSGDKKEETSDDGGSK
jgi:tetratricopeptide (TPR) repeat protein